MLSTISEMYMESPGYLFSDGVCLFLSRAASESGQS